ncbi:MAG: hypothetical protein KF690_06690 [Bacteroidetes bacterium]|nr:hypothetical protein [Bacteroidota bacterium]
MKSFFFALSLAILALPLQAQKKYVTTGVIEFNDKNYTQARQNLELALASPSLLAETDIVKAHYYYYATLMEIVQQNSRVDAVDPATGVKRSMEEMKKLVQQKLDEVFAKMPEVADKSFTSFRYVSDNDPKGTYKDMKMQYYLPLLQLQAYKIDQHARKENIQREDLQKALVYARNLEYMSALTGMALQKITPKILNAKLLMGMRTHADTLEAQKELKVFADNFDKALGGVDPETRAKMSSEFSQAVAFVIRAYSDMGDYETALSIVNRAQKFFPDNQEIGDAEMDVYLHPKLVNESIPRFKKELAENPDDVKMNIRMARVMKRKSDTSRDKAQALIDSLKKGESTLTRPQIYQMVKETESAIAVFEPEVQEAVDYYKKAIALDGKNYLAYYNLGAVFNNWAALHGDFYNVIPYNNASLIEKTMARRNELLREALTHMDSAYQINKDPDALNKCHIISVTLDDQEKVKYYESLKQD